MTLAEWLSRAEHARAVGITDRWQKLADGADYDAVPSCEFCYEIFLDVYPCNRCPVHRPHTLRFERGSSCNLYCCKEFQNFSHAPANSDRARIAALAMIEYLKGLDLLAFGEELVERGVLTR